MAQVYSDRVIKLGNMSEKDIWIVFIFSLDFVH